MIGSADSGRLCAPGLHRRGSPAAPSKPAGFEPGGVDCIVFAPVQGTFFFSHLVKALHIPDAVSRELPGGVKAGWTLEQNATYVRSCLHGFCWKLPFWHFGTAPILSKRLKTIAARLYLRYVRSNVQTIVYFVALRSPSACLLHWPTDCPLSCP